MIRSLLHGRLAGLPTSLGAAAQQAVLANTRQGSITPVSDQLRLGVIGCGRIAQVAHLPAIAKAGSVELRTVCDTSPHLAKAMGERYGVTAHTDVPGLLGDRIDAVLVAVPDRFHAAVAMQALQAGKHVIVEKPIAESVEEAETLARLADVAGVQLQVASMQRFDPGVQYAAQAAAGLGAIRSVSGWYRVMSRLRPPTEATFFPPLVIDPAVRSRELEYKAAHRGEHLLATHGIHVFDLLRFLAGDYQVHSAILSHNGADYSWHALGRLEAGGALSIEVTASVHAEWSEGIDIYGDLGHLRLRCPFVFTRQASSIRIFDETSQMRSEPVFGKTDPYERQIEGFATAILSGQRAEPTAEDGIQALRVVEAIRKATAAAGPER
jgi:predicted dehydrogenase